MIFYNFANKCLQLITAKSDEISGSGFCYLGLCTDEPIADGSVLHEISSIDYPSYERIQLNVTEAMPYADKWGIAKNGIIYNAEEFTSRECTEESGWPECSHFVIFDAKVGGNPLVGDVLRNPDGLPDETTGLYPEHKLTVGYNKVAVFREGTLQLQLK